MSLTLLSPYPLAFPSPSVQFHCETWWTCRSTRRHTWRARSDSLLATELPLSVLPPSIRDVLDVEITPVPGWRDSVPTWFGVKSSVGRVKIWLPVEATPRIYRNLSLLVLLPKDDLPDAPPFVHLGTQFLMEYQTQILLNCGPATTGELHIP